MPATIRQQILSIIGVVCSSAAVRQSVILLLAQTSTAVLLAISFLLVSRVLGPTWFGVFSVFTALVAIWMKVPDLGMNQALITTLGAAASDSSAAQRKTWLILEWKWWGSVGLLVAGAAALPFLPQIFLYPWPELIALSIIGGVGLGCFETMYTFLLGRHAFWAGGLLSVGQAFGKLAAFAAILWWVVRFSGDEQQAVYQLGLWYVLLPTVGAAVFWPRMRGWLGSRPTTGFLKARQQLLPFLRHTAVGTIALTLLQNLDIVLVQGRFSAYETGLYAGASRVALFVSLLTYSLSGVLNNRASHYRDRANLQSYLRKSLSIVGLAAVGFLVFFPLRSFVLQLTLGSEYAGAESALVLLIANALLSLAVVPAIAVFYGQDQPNYFSIGGVLQVGTLLAVYFLLAPRLGIEGMAWARLSATIIFALFTGFKLSRLAVWKPGTIPPLVQS